MNSWILSAEAEECRLLALDLAGRPEEPFLLRLASAFEDLHARPPWTTSDVAEREDRPSPLVLVRFSPIPEFAA